jgi:acetyl/propionyl-CoA carboxylase alpha subunit
MQTKEGAGSLFSMAIVNDRITRFVRDNNLPVLIFGFGDCTGGAQASFVTHPLVQNYYFSGTNMPFAGQIVVPSHLPLSSTLSNYLSRVPGAMKGLVQHPFEDDLDNKLQEIDPGIPTAKETVEEVIERVLKGHFATDGNDDDDEVAIVEPRKVKKTLIHARGCTAAKLIRIAQEKGVEVVLVQSDADMDSAPAEQLTDKDHLVCIGGNTPDESYLNARSIMRIAEREGADSLHPGIGFLSENAQFAALCGSHGINFIGPPVSSMELMGNKSNAIKTAQRLKVPVVPGSHGIVTSPAAAEAVAEEIGYPVIIKAVHGGGGKGIQVVHDPADFRELFSRISAEARAAFGSSDCYIERFVTSLRHVEIQILRDTHGNTCVLGLRDCSVQRNNQKIVEESDSTLITPKLRKQVYKCAGDIADDIGYVGAGTVEFIFDLDANAVYFMEMNTRLQVEHPVTEKVTGIDIVGAQFDIASGGSIKGMKPGKNGYAIELRITAEKAEITPDGGITFIPNPGTITKMDLPKPDHIDLICAVSEGKTISPYYDSMIVQVIAHGKDREDTVKKLLEWLDAAVIEGVCTNVEMLKLILTDEVFRSGEYDTGYLPKFFERTDLKKMIKDTEKVSGTAGQTLDKGAIEIEGSDELKVLAQGAGIFYLTPSPADPEFVSEGDVIDVEQTMCLVEAMKLFRPINLAFYGELYADHDKYEVVRIGPATGQAVNKGDLLFVIKPAK